jgi:hypothetical protein
MSLLTTKLNSQSIQSLDNSNKKSATEMANPILILFEYQCYVSTSFPVNQMAAFKDVSAPTFPYVYLDSHLWSTFPVHLTLLHLTGTKNTCDTCG